MNAPVWSGRRVPTIHTHVPTRGPNLSVSDPFMVVYGQSLEQWTSCRVNGSNHGSTQDINMQVLLHVLTCCLDKYSIAHSCFFLLTKGYTMESLSSSRPNPTRKGSSPGYNTVSEEEGPPSYNPFAQRKTVFNNLCPIPTYIGTLVGGFQPQEEVNKFLQGYGL
jgi:hypothetical protein